MGSWVSTPRSCLHGYRRDPDHFDLNADHNTSDTEVLAIVTLMEDGSEIARFSASLAPNTGDGGFDFFGSIPVAWTFAAAAGSHVYSINGITDTASDGTWTAQNRALFVDVLSP